MLLNVGREDNSAENRKSLLLPLLSPGFLYTPNKAAISWKDTIMLCILLDPLKPRRGPVSTAVSLKTIFMSVTV